MEAGSEKFQMRYYSIQFTVKRPAIYNTILLL
jgi:hypothetical protein